MSHELRKGNELQVGDHIRHSMWGPSDDYLLVTAVGEVSLLARANGSGHESQWSKAVTWVKIEPPLVFPERWINIYSSGTTSCHDTRSMSEAMAKQGRCLGVLHLFSDGHTEMETP